MLTKTKIVLSALLVVGFASAAMASDASEAASSQGSLSLAQAAQQPAGIFAFASANGVVKPVTVAEQATFDRTSNGAVNR